jgi:hypothetical protein
VRISWRTGSRTRSRIVSAPAALALGVAAAAGVAALEPAAAAADRPVLTVIPSWKPASFTGPGQTLALRYKVTNTGAQTLSKVGVRDPRSGVSAVSCPHPVLAAGQAQTCTASLTTTQADVDRGFITDVATATGQRPSGGGKVTSVPAHRTIRAAASLAAPAATLCSDAPTDPPGGTPTPLAAVAQGTPLAPSDGPDLAAATASASPTATPAPTASAVPTSAAPTPVGTAPASPSPAVSSPSAPAVSSPPASAVSSPAGSPPAPASAPAATGAPTPEVTESADATSAPPVTASAAPTPAEPGVAAAVVPVPVASVSAAPASCAATATGPVGETVPTPGATASVVPVPNGLGASSGPTPAVSELAASPLGEAAPAVPIPTRPGESADNGAAGGPGTADSDVESVGPAGISPLAATVVPVTG